jgi:hypothetical protein
MKLKQRRSQWHRALRDAHTGPLVVAADVCEVADDWEAYRDEAGGDSAPAWLKRNLGRSLAFFKVRQAAVATLGEDVRRWMDHAVAVRVSRQSAEHVPEIKRRLRIETKQRGDNPLPLELAMPIVYDVIGREPKRRTCQRCQRLEAVLRDLARRCGAAEEEAILRVLAD